MALFTRVAKLDPEVHGARCARAMAVHHAVGNSCQRNRGYRLSKVNMMAQDLSTLDPSLSRSAVQYTPLYKERSRYTHTIRLA